MGRMACATSPRSAEKGWIGADRGRESVGAAAQFAAGLRDAVPTAVSLHHWKRGRDAGISSGESGCQAKVDDSRWASGR